MQSALSSDLAPEPRPANRTPPVQNIIIIDDFSYERLPPDEAEYLRDKAAFINARLALTHTLAVEIGGALLEAKAAYPGVFLSWFVTEFDFSVDTAENYMKVARNMPELDNPERYNMRALYTLAGENVPESAREAAAGLATAGLTVDYETSYILAHAPEPIRQRFQAQDLTKQKAYALARTLNRKSIPPDVKQYALEQQVSDSAVVEYLAEAYQTERKTARYAQPSKTYSEIKGDNGTLNGFGWSASLKDANQRDIERFKADRRAMHIDQSQEAFDWIRCKATVAYDTGGQPVIYPLGAKLPNGLDGETVMIDIRVLRKT